MKYLPVKSVAAVSGFFVCSAASGADRFPPPEFRETGHKLPQTVGPLRQFPFMDTVDIIVLTAALAVAAYLVLKVRRRKWIFLLMVLCLGYFGFFRQGCICPIGAIQNTVFAVFNGGYTLPAVVAAFFALPLLAALFFGRVFCGSVCPLGAIQDIFALKPVKVPVWIAAPLGLVPWAVLALAVAMAVSGAGFPVCRWDPFVGFFRLGGPWRMLVIGGLVLALGVVVARPYCRYLCPYGALLGLASRISYRRLRTSPDECINCRLCENSCPFGCIREPLRRGIYHRREGLVKLAIITAALPLAAGAGLVSGTLLGNVIKKTHPTVARYEKIRRDQQLTSEHREFTASLETKAWQDPGAIAMFNDRLDSFIRNPSWPEDGATKELLKTFLESGDRNRDELRMKLLARKAELAGERTATAVIIAMVFVGIAGWIKLVSVNLRRHHTGHSPDPALCFSCGRCIESCPVENAKRREDRESC